MGQSVEKTLPKLPDGIKAILNDSYDKFIFTDKVINTISEYYIVYRTYEKFDEMKFSLLAIDAVRKAKDENTFPFVFRYALSDELFKEKRVVQEQELTNFALKHRLNDVIGKFLEKSPDFREMRKDYYSGLIIGFASLVTKNPLKIWKSVEKSMELPYETLLEQAKIRSYCEIKDSKTFPFIGTPYDRISKQK
ncbi:hypothetical protein [Bacillus timonensis]|uniref:hypothetical protein n=1 Tax=Bacillus timonensis TaxID=1033734 RepID=UPI00028972ED|nr:hypothetical protein [Bacillus timonensis]